MDPSSQAPPQQRDMVYCHECENEWYRDEHGLTCPDCHSDFTEIIEPDHDPRADEQHIPADHIPHPHLHQHQHQHGEFYGAPDPDEEDIDNIGWRQTGPGEFRHSVDRTFQFGPGQQQQQQGGGLFGGLFGALGNMLGGAVEQQQGQHPGFQQQRQQQQQQQQQRGYGQEQRPQSPDAAQGRSASVPGTARGGTNVRHVHGPGFHMSIMTSSSGGPGMGGAIGGMGGGGNLFPRNPDGPQPFQQQPDHIEQMIGQILMNIGPFDGGPRGPHQQGGMHGGFGGPFMMPGHPGMGPGAAPFGNLFQMFGMGAGGPGGQFGDAVFSQEALDRIVTQLMEQHQSGNAPGPASEEAIKALPSKTIDAKDLGENGKAECTICMDEVELGSAVTVLPCGHWFHYDCIKAWLSEHDTCPHCRQGITPRDNTDANRPRDPTQPPLHDMMSPEYQRPRDIPGGFPGSPLSRQESGSQEHPFTVPDGAGPRMHRRSSSTPAGRPTEGSRQGSASGASGGVFKRMRNAFGSNNNSREDRGGGGGGGAGEGGSGGSET